jgi:hypothetical protein
LQYPTFVIMQNTVYLIKKLLIISCLLGTQISKAQNVSVSLFGNLVLMTMSGSTTVSDLSTSLNAGNDTLFIKVAIGSGTLSLTGSPTGISVDNTNKIVSIDLTSFSAFEGIELLGSSGNDNVTIGPGGIDFSNVNAASNLSFTVELWTGTDVININNKIRTKGAGDISINVSKAINITSDISTESGSIYLTSNLQPTATTGNFSGINISGDISTDSAVGGEIYIEGRGGNSSSGNYGVYVHSGNSISSGSGAITIIGTGGASTGNSNHGIFLSDANTSIVSPGAIALIGFGGGTGSSSANNVGVFLDSSGGAVQHTGTDPSITLTITGYGGVSSNKGQTGVILANEVTSSGGNIYIEGLGGSSAGSFNANIGVVMQDQGNITASGDASITLVGTATAVQSSSDGIQMHDNTSITTTNGSISVTGISHSNNMGFTGSSSNTISTGNDRALSLVANKADLVNLSAGQGTIAILASAGIDMDLGGADGSSALGLLESELDMVSCKRLILGDTTQTGSIVISDKLDPQSVTDSIELNTGASIYFTSDTLHLNGRVLNMDCQSVFRTVGKLDVSDANAVLVLQNNSPVTFPQGLITGSINKLIINGGGGLILGDSLTITGDLALNNGKINLGNYTLNLDGTISAMSDNNSIIGSSSSKLKIGGSGATSMGRLYFASGNEILHTLTLNRSGATGSNAVVGLGTKLTIGNTLNLINGKMALDSHVLAFTGTTINGGHAASYIQIKGTAGFKRAGGSSVLFPIGYNPYLPIVLNCASCGGTDFTAQVAQGVTDAASSPITTDVIDATWSVTSSTAQTADLTFQWPSAAELTMPHVGITLGSRLSPSASWSRLQTNLTVSGSDPFSVSYSGFSFTSGAPTMFGIGGAASPLPANIIKIEAGCDQLVWQVAHEEANTDFDILGSMDGNQWKIIGHVQGSGNTSTANTYSFDLNTKKETYNFFRLNSRWNGNESQSSIISSACKTTTKDIMSIYPNPVKDELMLSQVPEGSVIRVFNSMGNLVYESVCDGEQHRIDMDTMPAGLYIVQVDGKAFNILKTE